MSLNLSQTLIRMLGQLLKDIQINQHQGSGYYSCVPLVRRYNKLLAQAVTLFPQGDALIGTFELLPDTEPKDPSDKMKALQSIQVESGQLITLLESIAEEPKTS